MGLGDKLKELKKQAQESVAEHSEQIHDAMGVAAAAVDKKTHGKHTAKIAKFGQKAVDKVDQFTEGAGQGGEAPAAHGAEDAAAEGAEHEAAAGAAADAAGGAAEHAVPPADAPPPELT